MISVGTPAANTCSYTVPSWYSMWTVIDHSRDATSAETPVTWNPISAVRAAANTPGISIFFMAFVTGQFLECRIVNKSTVAQTVRIQMFNSDGAVVTDSGNQTVAASGFFGISEPSEIAGSHCRFSTGAAKSLLRASIDVLDGSGGGIVVALPAE
jgi:hypothetical protein